MNRYDGLLDGSVQIATGAAGPVTRTKSHGRNGAGWVSLRVRALSWACTSMIAMLHVCCGSASGSETVEFNRDIRPLLSDRCFACHGPDSASREADLRLDRRKDAVARGVLEPGAPEDSEIWLRISSSDDDVRMPPLGSHKKALTADEIQLVRRWIAQGARYEQHWSLLPPRRPLVPASERDSWSVNPIDRFVAREHHARGFTPSTRADEITLVRRVYLDLLGVPPHPEDVKSYCSDHRPDAYLRLVDRLLASPMFGERLAIYWLDLVRFANSVGYHGDQEHAIDPYREYVIEALNDNRPFDQFTIEQLAGDLLPDATIEQQIASGYNRLLQTSHEGGVQVHEYLTKYAADRVRNLSSTWMGATMGCAECHDHKFDPYSQKNFYELAAFFADVDDSQTFRGSNAVLTEREPEVQVPSRVDRQRLKRLRQQLAELQANRFNDDPHARQTELDLIEEQIADIQRRTRRTMVTRSVTPRTTRVLVRGDWMDKSGEIVGPEVPDCLPSIELMGPRGTRLDLARWLTSPQHPQTARVFVNRLWYLLTGEGLSRNLDDTGSQGEWPTHPALLDWLATEFVESGWDVKHMVRLIVTSETYRQSSLVSPEDLHRDPENRWLARANRYRLSAELVRDTLLSISGLLVRETGGRGVRPPQPEGYYRHLNFPTRKYQADQGKNQYRRGVYVHWQRQYLHPMLKAFDAPSREECTAIRPRSNTPQAALTMLNDPTAIEAAVNFAAAILNHAGRSDEERIRWGWRRATSRDPVAEIDVLASLVADHRRQYANDPEAARRLITHASGNESGVHDVVELAAWSSVARAILNLNEVIMRN